MGDLAKVKEALRTVLDCCWYGVFRPTVRDFAGRLKPHFVNLNIQGIPLLIIFLHFSVIFLSALKEVIWESICFLKYSSQLIFNLMIVFQVTNTRERRTLCSFSLRL